VSLDERGILLQRYSRIPGWMPWVVLVLVLIIGEPLVTSWYHGHLEAPKWLESQFGVLLVIGLVLALVSLISSLVRQLVSEMFGAAYVGALYAKGFVVRRHLKEHFRSWASIRGIRQVLVRTTNTSPTGATSEGPTFAVYEIDCGDGFLINLRDTDTANLISARAGLEWNGDVAVAPHPDPLP
jgi:hypothetical protein